MLPTSKATCGVVVSKRGDDEKVCPDEASAVISIANPDDLSQIVAIVVMCSRHEQELESGKALIFKGETGDHIAVQYEEQSHDAEHDATQPA